MAEHRETTIGKPGSPERDHFMKVFDRQYHPCDTGLHFCGIDDDADLPCGPHFTVLNLPMSAEAARVAFDRAKLAFSVPHDEMEVLVDLRIDGSCEDDFGMRRQMVEPMQRSIA